MPNENDMSSTTEPQEVQESFDREAEEYVPFEYTITSYGADYPVDGLVKRIDDGSIYVPPFQREFVWNVNKASRFIESLLLGLPVPGIFLSKEEGTGKLLVIDGQQRLKSLQYFYNGVFEPTEAKFKLRNVNHRFNGLAYKDLEEEDRRRLDDSILHATVIRQEKPKADDSSIYHIFERLNTGGVILQPQEIRSCVYHGPFSDLLKTLNENEAWRALFGKVSSRMRDRELILRFLALHFRGADHYFKPMKEFLNQFMALHRWLDDETSEMFEKSFVDTVEVILSAIGNDALKPYRIVKAAVADAVMVGVANRLQNGPITNKRELNRAHVELLEDEDFLKATDTATTDEENVKARVSTAIKAFADIP